MNPAWSEGRAPTPERDDDARIYDALESTNNGHVAPPKRDSPFPHVWIDDAQISFTNNDLVKGLVPQSSLILIYGPSGDGKTFWTIDLACHIAEGRAWRERRVRRSLVVYVAAEAGTSIVRRFVARRSPSAADRTPLAIVTKGADLLDAEQVTLLMAELQIIANQAGIPLGLVIFDTFSRSTPGGDENAAQDVTRAVRAADRIRDTLGASTGFVHHSGKDASKGARGHSSLFAAADAVIQVADRVATVEKSRDGATGDSFPFDLKVIDLGEDSDGDVMTTCVVEHVTDIATRPERKPPPGNAGIAFTALQESIQDRGITLPESSTVPRGAKAVTLTVWRDQFRLRYGNDDAQNLKKAWQRVRSDLLKGGYIQISDPYVWVA